MNNKFDTMESAFPTMQQSRMPMALPDSNTIMNKNKDLTQKLLEAQKENAKQQV